MLSDHVPVPGAGSLDQRVLRVAPAAAQPPSASEPGLEPGEVATVSWTLRRAAGAVVLERAAP